MEGLLRAGMAFLSFLYLVHFTLFFLCYQLLGDGGAMLAASAMRADGAEELMAEKLQQAARWPAGAALAGERWRRRASCPAALARLPLVVRLVALHAGGKMREEEERKKKRFLGLGVLGPSWCWNWAIKPNSLLTFGFWA